jgi:hypothetical protein
MPSLLDSDSDSSRSKLATENVDDDDDDDSMLLSYQPLSKRARAPPTSLEEDNDDDSSVARVELRRRIQELSKKPDDSSKPLSSSKTILDQEIVLDKSATSDAADDDSNTEHDDCDEGGTLQRRTADDEASATAEYNDDSSCDTAELAWKIKYPNVPYPRVATDARTQSTSARPDEFCLPDQDDSSRSIHSNESSQMNRRHAADNDSAVRDLSLLPSSFPTNIAVTEMRKATSTICHDARGNNSRATPLAANPYSQRPTYNLYASKTASSAVDSSAAVVDDSERPKSSSGGNQRRRDDNNAHSLRPIPPSWMTDEQLDASAFFEHDNHNDARSPARSQAVDQYVRAHSQEQQQQYHHDTYQASQFDDNNYVVRQGVHPTPLRPADFIYPTSNGPQDADDIAAFSDDDEDTARAFGLDAHRRLSLHSSCQKNDRLSFQSGGGGGSQRSTGSFGQAQRQSAPHHHPHNDYLQQSSQVGMHDSFGEAEAQLRHTVDDDSYYEAAFSTEQRFTGGMPTHQDAPIEQQMYEGSSHQHHDFSSNMHTRGDDRHTSVPRQQRFIRNAANVSGFVLPPNLQSHPTHTSNMYATTRNDLVGGSGVGAGAYSLERPTTWSRTNHMSHPAASAPTFASHYSRDFSYNAAAADDENENEPPYQGEPSGWGSNNVAARRGRQSTGGKRGGGFRKGGGKFKSKRGGAKAGGSRRGGRGGRGRGGKSRAAPASGGWANSNFGGWNGGGGASGGRDDANLGNIGGAEINF